MIEGLARFGEVQDCVSFSRCAGTRFRRTRVDRPTSRFTLALWSYFWKYPRWGSWMEWTSSEECRSILLSLVLDQERFGDAWKQTGDAQRYECICLIRSSRTRNKKQKLSEVVIYLGRRLLTPRRRPMRYKICCMWLCMRTSWVCSRHFV